MGATQRQLTWEHSKCTAECWEAFSQLRSPSESSSFSISTKDTKDISTSQMSQSHFSRGNLTSTSSRHSYPWLRGKDRRFYGLMRDPRETKMLGMTVTFLRRRMGLVVWRSWKEHTLSNHARGQKKKIQNKYEHKNHQARTLDDQKWDEATIECDRASLPKTTRPFSKRQFWYQTSFCRTSFSTLRQNFFIAYLFLSSSTRSERFDNLKNVTSSGVYTCFIFHRRHASAAGESGFMSKLSNRAVCFVFYGVVLTTTCILSRLNFPPFPPAVTIAHAP